MIPQLPLTPDKLAAYIATLGEPQKEETSEHSTSSRVVPNNPNRAAMDNARPEQTTETDRAARGTGERKPSVAVGNTASGNTAPNATSTGGVAAPTAVTPARHFPLVPEPEFPKPKYTEDAKLTEQGARVLWELWQPPNKLRDIEQLAAYFSVPPEVVHRELLALELIEAEWSGEQITVEWMIKDAREARARQRESRERFLRDNEGRDVESAFYFEEWAFESAHSTKTPLNDFVLDANDTGSRAPQGYLAAEDEDAAREIEQALDATVGAEQKPRSKRRSTRV